MSVVEEIAVPHYSAHTSMAVPATTARGGDGAHAFVLSLVGGVGVGLLATFHGPGIGLSIGVLLTVALWLKLAAHHKRTVATRERIVLAAIALLGAMPTWRSSVWLLNYDLVAAAALLLLLPWAARAPRMRLSLSDGGAHLLEGLQAAARGSADLLVDDGDAERLRPTLQKVAIVAAIAVPLSAVFLALFGHADPVVAGLLTRAGNQFAGLNIARAAIGLGIGWAICGAAYAATATWRPQTTSTTPVTSELGAAEIGWVGWILSALFAMFLVVQGLQIVGFAEALRLPGVTYSGAARDGFFQLLAAVGLVVGIVLIATWQIDRTETTTPQRRRTMRALSVLLVLTIGVAMSALWRMAMYTDAYGLTEMRFHASALMVWLMAMLFWLQRTALRERRDGFLPGAIASMVVSVLALHVVNPDALIANHNLHREKVVDVAHLMRLSDDSIPTVHALVASISDDATRMHLCDALAGRATQTHARMREASLLSWSWAAARADAPPVGCFSDLARRAKSSS